MVVGHPGQPVGVGSALDLATKVNAARQPQRREHLLVVRGERGQVVGAKQLAPFHRPPTVADVTAQVTKVARPHQSEGACGRVAVAEACAGGRQGRGGHGGTHGLRRTP